MIYTLTLNPCIDHIIYIDDYKDGKINKSCGEDFIAGGKGINVSRVLNILNMPSIAISFVGGNTGEWFKNMLLKEGIKTLFIDVKTGNTRVNTKVKSKLETDFNSPGICVLENESDILFKKLNDLKKTIS